MRNDSIFYDVLYPESNGDTTTKPEPVIEFNENIVLAGVEEIKETKNKGIYNVKLANKQEPIDIPELSIVAHLDDQQTNVEVYNEMLKLVQRKQYEAEDCDKPQTDNTKGDE